jgi:hypothetical protein
MVPLCVRKTNCIVVPGTHFVCCLSLNSKCGDYVGTYDYVYLYDKHIVGCMSEIMYCVRERT